MGSILKENRRIRKANKSELNRAANKVKLGWVVFIRTFLV